MPLSDRLKAIPLVALAFSAVPAFAQSLHLAGEASLSATTVADDPAIGRLDFDLTFPLAAKRGLPLSLEIGAFAYVLPQKRPHETYVALAWDERLRLGVVRPAYDFVLPSVFARHAPYLAYARAEYTRAYTTTNAMRRTAVPWGLSYTDQSDTVKWAASAHNASKGGFRSASLAARWDRGEWQLAAAAEGVWDFTGAHGGTNAKLGASWTGAPWTVGAAYLHPGAEKLPDAVSLDVSYQINSHLSLSGFGEVTDKGQDDAFGIAAEYALPPKAALSLAATQWHGDTGLHLTLSRHF